MSIFFREWPIYEAAKARGYLVTPGGGLARVRLRTCYWHFCSDLSRPFVVTELRQRWASIEMDLIEIPPRLDERAVSWQLSDRAFRQIYALLGEHTKPGAWWSSGHVFVYSSAIPIAVSALACGAHIHDRLHGSARWPMKGRTPPIYVTGIRADDRSQDVDGAYFTRYPDRTEYTRAYIAGETPEPLPVGTTVIVKRIGAARARAFVLPQEGLN